MLSQKVVTPVKTGVQPFRNFLKTLDSGFRRNDHQINEMAQLLKSIAHPLRLKILCLLQTGELSVGALRQQVHSSDANVSQHLAIMRRQGIIAHRRQANYIYNRIADPRITELIKAMQQLFCRDDGQEAATAPSDPAPTRTDARTR